MKKSRRANAAPQVQQEQQVLANAGLKDVEIANLQRTVEALHEQLAQHRQNRFSQEEADEAIQNAVARREEELRVWLMQRDQRVKDAKAWREQEIANEKARREEEFAEAMRNRHAEVDEAWAAKEGQIRREIDQEVQEWVQRAAQFSGS